MYGEINMEGKAVKIIVSVLLAVVIAGVIVFALSGRNGDRVTDPESNISDNVSDEATDNTSESTSEPTSEPVTQREIKDVETLVNYANPIPENWTVDLVDIRNGEQVDRRAYESLQKMMDDCRAQGYNPLVCSSYRTNETQVRLFNNKVQQYMDQGYSESAAKEEAGKWVAVPGTSEHQTGLALDIVSVENQNLNNSQLDTPCQQWLMEHCYDYGFILRYPEDKVDITRIDFEPWHYRYVGIDAAQEIKEKGICLEEFFEMYS